MLFYSPLQVHTIPLEDDNLLYPILTCPRHTQLLNEYIQSLEIKSIFEKHKDFIDFIHKNSEVQNITLNELTIIYDTLFVQHLKGFE